MALPLKVAEIGTCSQVPSVLVGQPEPIFQQPATFGSFRMRSLIKPAEVRAVSRWGNLGSEDHNVEMLVGPLVS